MLPSSLLPQDASDAAILVAVDQWVAGLLGGPGTVRGGIQRDRAQCCNGMDSQLNAQVITQYGDAQPGQKVTVEGKPTDISQHKDVRRFTRNKHGFVGHVWYDLNINGIASDLTATFGLRAA